MSNNSEEEINNICRIIGQRVRMIRKEKKLTLDVLSEKSGFSKSYLSQIENMNREPSIGTLSKIARSLGTDALFLISGINFEAEQTNIAIVKENERKSMSNIYHGSEYTFESLAYKKKDRLMDAYILEFEFKFPKNIKPWQGETFVYILEGKHEFLYNGTSYILKKGDSFYFDASKPYMGRSIGSKKSKALVVSTFTSGRKPI